MTSLDDNDDHDDVMMMMRKTSLKGCPIADVCSNTERVVMTTFDGRVYTCDVADSSKQQNYVEVDFPTYFPTSGHDQDIDIVSVCCGRYHFLALSADGRVYSWGRNDCGQLGTPNKKRKHKIQNLSTQAFTPGLIKGLSKYGVIHIACGEDHSLALTRDGRLFSWGSNNHGQLGVETQGKRAKHHTEKPMEIEALLGVPLQHIAAGGAHSAVLSTSGSVFMWGRNTHGQLGLQQLEDVKIPVKLGYISQKKVKDISCGMHHTSLLKENGELLVYGIGVGRLPCDIEQWNESELRPGQPHRFRTFSFMQSTSRCTYLVDEINGDLYVLNHDNAGQDGPSRNLQLDPLDGRLFIDLLEPDSLTEWPPGRYAFDEKVWELSRPLEGLVTSDQETRRDEIEQFEIERAEQQRGTVCEYQRNDLCSTAVQDDTEHGTFSDGGDSGNFDGGADDDDDGADEEHHYIDCMDIVNDAYTDYESFVSCNDDYISTACNDFPDEPEVSVRHMDEQDDVFRNHAGSVEQASKGSPSLAQFHQRTSSEGHSEFSNSSPGTDRTQTRSNSMSSETATPHSNTQLVNRVAVSSDYAANPTAATIPTSNATQNTAVTAQMGVSLNDGSAFHDESLVALGDGTTDLVAAVGAASVSNGGYCSEEETEEDESGATVGQENNPRPSRSLRRICTGQEHIFIIELNEPVGNEVHFSVAPRKKIDTLSAELIQRLKDAECDLTEGSSLFQSASRVFSSTACINASFQQRGPNEVKGLNVDLKAAAQAFELINKNTKLIDMISKVVLVNLCKDAPQSTPHEEALRFYLILMECPIISNPYHVSSRRILAAVGRLMGFLGNASPAGDPNPNSATLASWWKFEPMSFRRMITAYRVALTFLISDRNILEMEMDHFWTYLKVLSSLNQVNLQQDIVSIKTFYIPDLEKFTLLQMQIILCAYNRMHPHAEFPWMSYSFLISLERKANILEIRNMIEQMMAMKVERSRLAPMYDLLSRIGLCSPSQPFLSLHIKVHRDDIFGTSVQEQLAKMLSCPKSSFLKPFQVSFEGEMGIDAGALSMDFFRLVFEELLDPKKNDLFRYITEVDPTHSSVWFRKDCNDAQTAEICGLLLGLSLYNKALVPLPFPQLLYAKLLGKGPKSEMEEVAELDKDFADQMSKLMTGTEEYVIGSCYGDELELEDGRSVEITKENVHLYVEKMVREHLVPGQFAAFQQGFNKVYNPTIMSMFRPIELEALVMGEKYFDWIALEQSAQYTMPYTALHSTIKMFWKVFHKLDDDMKRKFLVFVSGSDRVPVGGLRNLGLTIAELPLPSDDSVVDDDRLALLLPVGHGCDNHGSRRTLELPMYTTPALIEDRLTVALSYYDCPFHIA